MANTTKIAKSRFGGYRCGIDDSMEPANGPVTTYRLSPEEIEAKYGPPAPRKRDLKNIAWREGKGHGEDKRKNQAT